jgi:hypothetical protein
MHYASPNMVLDHGAAPQDWSFCPYFSPANERLRSVRKVECMDWNELTPFSD